MAYDTFDPGTGQYYDQATGQAGNPGVQGGTQAGTPAQTAPAQPNYAYSQAQPTAQSQTQTAAQSLLQPGYLGTPSTYQGSTVAPTPAQSSQYDLSGLYSNWGGANQLDPKLLASLGSGQTTGLLQQSFQPGDQNANNNLQQQLAAYGVTGGQAVGAMTQLQAQLAAAHSPALASAIQNSQANQLNAGQFNAGAQNTNTNQLNSLLGNALGQNNSNNESTNQFNAGNDLTAALANQGSTNQASNYAATANNTTNAANVGEFNQSQNQQLNALLQQYYAQLGAFNNINNSGQGAGNQNAVNYGQDITTQQDPFMQVFGDLAAGAGQVGAAYAKGGA